MTPRFTAFVRAVNVGTTNRIKMADLAGLFVEAGCEDVSWHLQAGNMLFAADAPDGPEALAGRIEAVLAGRGMRRADVMLWTTAELSEFVALDPFAGIDPDALRRCVVFMRRPPTATPTEKLLRAGAEVRHLDDRVLCYTLPSQIGAREMGDIAIDRPWGTPSTMRWWNVVADVAAKAAADES